MIHASNPYGLSFAKSITKRYNRDTSTMTHGQWMCQNTSLNKKNFSFDRYPFQEAIANDMHDNLCCMKPSQVGLALALDTPIPTLLGWKSMGDLKVGDVVFDEQGKPCNVTYISPVYRGHDCYTLTFDTGETITSDANHRWYFEAHKAFGEAGLYGKTGTPAKGYARKGVLKTSVLADIYHDKGRNLFAIPNTQPLHTPIQDLEVDPYVLGYWLGDGHTHSSTFTVSKSDADAFETQIKSSGYVYRLVAKRDNTLQYNVTLPRDTDLCPRGHSKSTEGTLAPWGTCKKCRDQNLGKEFREESVPYDTLYSRLTSLGVIGKEKHIPNQYLRASVSQRLNLLQGLMDTDGSITKKGRCSFYNTSEKLVAQVQELVASLGLKPRVRWRPPSGGVLKSGHVIQGKKPVAEVSFVAYTNLPVFRLLRKLERQPLLSEGRPTESLRRRVVKVEKVGSVPTRCITVDSESHLYLCGKGMIPTHNTEIQIRKSLTILSRMDGISLIYTMPNEKMFKRISQARILPIVQFDKAFASPERQSMGLIKIGTNFMYITGASEGDATSIDADIVFNDEVDLTPKDMLALFDSRLQGSDLRIRQQFSTPTYEGVGIHRSYASSDQMEYMFKCTGCNHHNIPHFTPKHVVIPGLPEVYEDYSMIDGKLLDDGVIDLSTTYVCCEKCRKPIDLGDTSRREWVPRFPSRLHSRGYRVRPFSTNRLLPSYILSSLFKYKARDNIKGFKNTVLGDVHTSENIKLSEEQVTRCMRTEVPPTPDKNDKHWIGIDMGLTCHIVIGVGSSIAEVSVILMTSCREDELLGTIARLSESYNIQGALDRYPYTPLSNDVRDKSNGAIVPVEYGNNREIAPQKDALGNISHIQVSRTMMLDYVFGGIRKGTWSLSGYGMEKANVVLHLTDMVREEEHEGAAKWVKLNNNDHFFHALAFMASGMVYNGVLEGSKDFEHVQLGMIALSQDFNMFAPNDLIGFHSETPQKDKQIRRHSRN